MLDEQVDYPRLMDLARRDAREALKLPVTRFPRLAAIDCRDEHEGSMAAGADGDLSVKVDFTVGAEGFPRADLSINGTLYLKCQRCLGVMHWPARIDSSLSVVMADDEAQSLEDPFDSVVMQNGGLDLVGVIEDEILAALPLAPVHSEDPACSGADGAEQDSKNLAESMHKPFAGLADLVSEQKRASDD